ncbi:MAG: transposase [Firmicutes bacterium]|nr:transposase [Bacillota bacterium]
MMLWQFMAKLSDRQMEAAARYDVRVRFFLGVNPEDPVPDAVTLCLFRKRLLQARRERQVFEALVEKARELGFLKQGYEELTDTTPLKTAAAVPTMVGLVQQGIRRVLLAWRDQDAGVVATVAQKLKLEGYLGERLHLESAGIKSKRGRRRFRKGVEQAYRLLDTLPAEQSQELQRAAEVLRRILDERTVPDDESEQDDPPSDPGKPPTDGRMATANDPDARSGRKGSRQWTGYKAAVFEDSESELIADVDVCPANRSDSETVAPHLERTSEHHRPVDIVADAAYGYVKVRQFLKGNGIVLIAPRTPKPQPGPHPGGGWVALPEDPAIRAKGERKPAEMVRYHGLRVARYIGLAKVKLQAYFTAAAVNLKRLALLLTAGATA